MSSIQVKHMPRLVRARVVATALGVAAVATLGVSTASGGPELRRDLAGAGHVRSSSVRTLSRVVAGVHFSLDVRTAGWGAGPITRDGQRFRSGSLLISKSERGPQGAEAVVFWTSVPRAEHAQPCTRLLGKPEQVSPAALAAVLASAPGTRLVRGPSNVTVGGRPAKFVVLSVRRDLGCDPGYFYSWPAPCWGACWVETNAGDTVKAWIVSVRGKLLLFEAETTKEASPRLEREVQGIVRSIRFR
jgi:hypothetical protein